MVQKWRVPKGPVTHVLMDGGTLNVPPEESNDFFREYIQTIQTGSKLYVVEQKTTRFKFFIDFDYKDPAKLSDEDIVRFCSIIHEATRSTSRCLIARTKPRPVKEGIKTGVHIHWPDFIVDRTQALNIRTRVILALGEGPWASIIDPAVYGGSGLRMLWSHKKPSGDPYIPWKSLDGVEFSKEPNAEILKLFSVRVDGEEPVIRGDSVDIDGLEEFVQRYLKGQRRTRVKKIQRHEHDGWFVQTDSKFCENIDREHKSNHVWFSIRSGRVSQRCFDEECAKFNGQEHILPPSIVEQLKDVDIVGSPVSSFFMDFFPDGPVKNLPEIRDESPPVFGVGPGKLAAFFDKYPGVREGP